MSIAKSLTNLLDHPIVNASQDRGRDITPTIHETLWAWRANVTERKPAQVYVENAEGELVCEGPRLDLFTAIIDFSANNTIINLPTYRRARELSIREDETILSGKNRHGEVIGVSSGSKTHSMNIKIRDYNVICDGKVGAPRDYMIVGDDGEWHKGWEEIEFFPSAELDDFLKDNEAYRADTIHFDSFVNPSLRNAFFGSRYLSTKALADRVKEEAKHYRGIARQIEESGISFVGERKRPKPRRGGDAGTPRKVQVLEAQLLLPSRHGNYPLVGKDDAGNFNRYDRMPDDPRDLKDILRYSKERAKWLSSTIGSRLKFVCKAVELAFFLHGFKGEREYGNEIRPGWGIPDWQREVKLKPRARNKYNALQFRDDITLAYRLWETTARTRTP